jgi:VanZ family protein
MVEFVRSVRWPPLAPLWRTTMLACWIAAIATVITLSLLPNIGPPGSYHLDKLIHAVSYCGLALLPAAVFERRGNALIAALAMIALGCGIEVLQIFVPQRAGDVWDAIANSFGALLGAAFAPQFRRLVRHMTAR